MRRIVWVIWVLWWPGVGWAVSETPGVITKETVLQWTEHYRNAAVPFQPGETIRFEELEKLRAFLPPGYFEEYQFPEVAFEIAPTGDYPPHPAYRQATEQFAGQTRLADDGTLVGYVAGQPFPNAVLDPGDPTSGLKAAWNFNFRWQNYGHWVEKAAGILLEEGGTHQPVAGLPVDVLQGPGGSVERVIWQRFQRVYFTHLPMHPESAYTLPVPDASQFEYKDHLEFIAPYDLRGQRMVIQRAADPHQPDQAWVYVPTLRKVRRFSAEEKADSFVGSDQTLDDFYGFSGRVLDWEWTFHGWKQVLHVMNSRHPYPHFYGPYGRVPEDRWELRPCAVITMVPKDPQHPYSSKVLFWDAQTYRTTIAMAFDRAGRLWKVWQAINAWSEDGPSGQDGVDHGRFVMRYLGVSVIDRKNKQATLFPMFGVSYPKVSIQDVERLYDLNKLSEGRR